MEVEDSSDRGRRGLALAFALCAVATATLLLSHPAGGGGSVADSLAAEARNQLSDAVVHGGFILTLCVLMVCFMIWSRMLGTSRVAVVVALVTFCVGSGMLIASMLLDGFVSPAIAARFVGAPGADNLVMARTLLVFCGTLIRFLMPLGLAFQCAAMLSWSWMLVQGSGAPRAIGTCGAISAVVLIVGLLLAPAGLLTHLLMGTIAVQILWYFALAAWLARSRGGGLPRTVEGV